MANNLVDTFNALPQSPTILSGNVPNKWHFDLRFIRRQPTSNLCLIILQPHNDFMHIASLPLHADTSLDNTVAALEYFPETAQEAAPEIVKSLLHFFVNVVITGGTSGSGTLAPWQLSTIDKALADAVSAELRRQGVCPPRLCNVGLASAEVNAAADNQLEKLLEGTWTGDDVIRAFDDEFLPKSVSLFNSAPNPYIPGGYADLEGPARYACMARHYGAMLARGTPPDGGPYHGPRSLVKEHNCLVEIQHMLMNKPAEIVRSAADHGDSSAALDYGVRLSLGLGCGPSRKLSRDYLIKAAGSKTASDKTKATANGLLVFWYLDACITEMVPIHFLYAACHHANLAAYFCERVSPPESPSSPAVIWLLDWVLNNDDDDMLLSNDDNMPSDLTWMYPNIFEVDEERHDRICQLDPTSLKRRLDQPHKYFCAALDCDIQSDFADALSECAGKCDKGKKPSYCSWHCQKADWAVHKPFCRPGARCSSIEDSSLKYVISGDRTAPTLRTPIKRLDGNISALESYTLTGTQLKALKPFSENCVRLRFRSWLKPNRST